jgi:hypothetical protein
MHMWHAVPQVRLCAMSAFLCILPGVVHAHHLDAVLALLTVIQAQFSGDLRQDRNAGNSFGRRLLILNVAIVNKSRIW